MPSRGASRKVVRYGWLIDALRGLARSVPTSAQKQEILESSKAVVDFLLELRAQLELIPTTEDMLAVERAVEQLEALVDASSRKPALAAVIGQSVRLGAGERRVARERDRHGVDSMIKMLQALPVDEIEGRLQNPSYSIGQLRDIASALGLRPAKTAERDGLSHQIAMNIANYRGYEQMSGQPRTSDQPEAERAD